LRIDEGWRYAISNAAGKIDAIVSRDSIFGIITRIGVDETFEGLTIHE
jgi:hypothetical protein